ncbi:type II restriction endonuclease [Pseudoxanthomonas mexicana]
MSDQGSLDLRVQPRVAEAIADGTPLWWKIQSLVSSSDDLFIKKLSRNDTSWADDTGKHQAGFYIPRPIREQGFFPDLIASNPDKPHIFHAEFNVLWPQTGETTLSGMRHYSNKGPETHFTRLPHTLFRNLTPASLLLSGKFKATIAGCWYWMIVLDSADEEAELLETVLDIQSGFHYALFSAAQFEEASRLQQDDKHELIDRLQHAIRNGSLESTAREYANLPSPQIIAEDARAQWLRKHGLDHFDPWLIARPGDAIMEISRDIEFTLYRKYELRRRAAELVALLSGKGDLVTSVVNHFPDIDRLLLSASQQRKTRAGRSFEHHIAASLEAGGIRFVEQAVTGGRRPDFVMPDLRTLQSRNRAPSEALVLAAKTTLRERWKQVSSERMDCEVLLATVDDRVAASTVNEMAAAGIRLVVPESLKASNETDYRTSASVISFRQFFDSELKASRPFLLR